MDDDDLFGDVDGIEEVKHHEGETEGFEAGKAQGKLEGQLAGWKRGYAFGTEVEYYLTLGNLLLKPEISGAIVPEEKGEKVLKVAKQMIELALVAQTKTPADEDVIETLQKLKAKAAVLAAVLKQPIHYEEKSEEKVDVTF